MHSGRGGFGPQKSMKRRGTRRITRQGSSRGQLEFGAQNTRVGTPIQEAKGEAEKDQRRSAPPMQEPKEKRKERESAGKPAPL